MTFSGFLTVASQFSWALVLLIKKQAFSLKEMLVFDPNLFSRVLKSQISLFKSVYLPELQIMM